MKKAIILTETKRIIRVKGGDFAMIPEGTEVISLTDDQATHFLSTEEPMFYIGGEIKTLSEKIYQEAPNDIKRNIRFNRDKMLLESDWTQLPDSPLSDSKKAEWATYRQTLRDLTDNIDSFGSVTYPDAPNS